MCKLLKSAYIERDAPSYGAGSYLIPLSAGRKCRCGDESAAMVFCEHMDGRTQLHYLQSGNALVDNEDVYVLLVAVWPAPHHLLKDRQS